jgi:hypothetical protein
MTPAWLLDIVAGVMLAVAALCAARLVAARPWARGGVVIDTDVAHLLMSIAMAGMLAPRLRTLPDTAWEIIFGLLAAWFAVRVTRDARRSGVRVLAGGHCAPHLVHSASMLYMALAMTAPIPAGTAPAAAGAGGMGMSGTSAMTLRYPTLALLFAFILVGYSIWDLDQLSGRRYAFGAARVSLAGAAAPAIRVPGLPALAAASPQANDQAVAAGATAAASGGDPAEDHAAGGTSTFLLAPAVTVGCRIAMGVAMAFMLFIAI